MQVDEPHELESERFKREAASVAVRGFQLLANVLEGLAQQWPKIGLSLLLEPLDQRRNISAASLPVAVTRKGLAPRPAALAPRSSSTYPASRSG